MKNSNNREVIPVTTARAPLHVWRRKPKVAIVHYWLIGMRGGEKVIEELCKLFPDADIFTHLYDPSRVSDTINAHTVKTTSIQGMPFAQKMYKKYVSFMPSALERLDLTEYDLVISSESGPAKGVIVRPGALHVCYVHTPMRYIWDQYFHYREQSGFLTRMMMPRLTHAMRQWDVTSAARVDHFWANSNAVAARIEKYWRRGSEVIPPPVNTTKFDAKRPRQDFYLFVSELVSYKRADLAIQACKSLNRRLIVIGDGPELKRLKKIAGPNTEFLGRVPTKVLADHMETCRAFLFPAEEDFGIVPVEAMSAGAPVIAYGRGGARDYVVPGKTGLFISDQSPEAMVEGIVRFEMMGDQFHAKDLASHAEHFDVANFQTRIKASLLEQIDNRNNLKWLGDTLRERWENKEERLSNSA